MDNSKHQPGCNCFYCRQVSHHVEQLIHENAIETTLTNLSIHPIKVNGVKYVNKEYALHLLNSMPLDEFVDGEYAAISNFINKLYE